MQARTPAREIGRGAAIMAAGLVVLGVVVTLLYLLLCPARPRRVALPEFATQAQAAGYQVFRRESVRCSRGEHTPQWCGQVTRHVSGRCPWHRDLP